ncbi:MAG: phosphohistidine phosphatase SixA [Proteobacteria bacterium]|nr:phosphohistidine phosphatase SixA [Pseudomonadota bacterium]NOG60668.1 phosphohistidine phosphatase SixA [Pseudomonadota bacterium]
MKLYLVQHGKSLSKEIDPGCPLSPEGEEDVRQVSEFLRASGITVNSVLHSGKMRAHQTAEIFADALLISGEEDVIDGIKPNDSIQDFSIKVHQFKSDTMLVGHLPFMEKMVSYLITGNEDSAIVAYKQGSVVCLQQDKEEHWRIQWMLRPETVGANYI